MPVDTKSVLIFQGTNHHQVYEIAVPDMRKVWAAWGVVNGVWRLSPDDPTFINNMVQALTGWTTDTTRAFVKALNRELDEAPTYINPFDCYIKRDLNHET